MLSVDSGHSLETTLHDVNMAACTVRDGGIVIVDDWFNQEWTGVQEATTRPTRWRGWCRLCTVTTRFG